MRVAIFAAAVILAACSRGPAEQNGETPGIAPAAVESAPEAQAAAPDPWPVNFPRPTADYAGVYDFAAAGETLEVKIAASGMKQRLTFPPGAGPGGAAGEWRQVIVNENAGEKMIMWPEGAGAPALAAMISRSDIGAKAVAFGVDADRQASAKRTGTDNIAGLDCAVWEFAGEGDEDAAGDACVTRDGIPLRVVSGGQTVMLAKSIDRGAQDPALFAPPAGHEVVDMGECMRIGAEMMAAVREGKTPDMAKMQKCQELGEKMGAMFGEQAPPAR